MILRAQTHLPVYCSGDMTGYSDLFTIPVLLIREHVSKLEQIYLFFAEIMQKKKILPLILPWDYKEEEANDNQEL